MENDNNKRRTMKKDMDNIINSFKRITNLFKEGFQVISQEKSAKPQRIKKQVISRKQATVIQPEEFSIEKSKFYTSSPAPAVFQQAAAAVTRDIPSGYNQDKIVLLVRDPWWVHSYWELTQATRDKFKESLGGQYHQAGWVLRVYDVSFIIFNGNNAHRYFDISINQDARSWYINVSSGRSFCVDLGLKMPDGSFITILRSNTVTMPLDGPSWVTDEEWFIPEDLFNKLYGLSFGAGSSPGKGVKQIRQERFISSPGFASMASPVKVKQLERKFWLVVNTELIVYGATEPDAKVKILDREVKLNKDGTFSLRFALPDGKHVIPVRAESKDSIDVRKITPIVTKESA